MFRFLKGLRKEKEPPAGLEMGDLPAWIGGEEEKVRDDLARISAAHRHVVLEARGRMEGVLSEFDAASTAVVPSTKLTGVTERSLPLFLKAMRTSLSRDLPDDPDGFYATASEVLKGCLSAFRGQGRYLASRFPEEMKLLRDAVDTMGREVNALTPEVARGRERLRELAGLRRIHGQYADAKKRASLVRAEIGTLEDDLARSENSLEEVHRALSEIEQGEEYRAGQGELARIRRLEGERDEAVRRSRAAVAPAVHLMRKGEKIASRKMARDATRALRDAILILDGDLPVPDEGSSRVLSLGMKTVATMVDSGELPLKNREETGLIQKPELFVWGILEISRRFREISGEIASAQEALRSWPALVRSKDLKGKGEELENRIAGARDRLDRLKEEGEELERQVRARFDEVRQKVVELSGKPVQVREEGPLSEEPERHG